MLSVNGCEYENARSATAKECLNTCQIGGLKLFCKAALGVQLMTLYHADVLLRLIVIL